MNVQLIEIIGLTLWLSPVIAYYIVMPVLNLTSALLFGTKP
jgi:hypothetical protein